MENRLDIRVLSRGRFKEFSGKLKQLLSFLSSCEKLWMVRIFWLTPPLFKLTSAPIEAWKWVKLQPIPEIIADRPNVRRQKGAWGSITSNDQLYNTKTSINTILILRKSDFVKRNDFLLLQDVGGGVGLRYLGPDQRFGWTYGLNPRSWF